MVHHLLVYNIHYALLRQTVIHITLLIKHFRPKELNTIVYIRIFPNFNLGIVMPGCSYYSSRNEL